MKIEFSDKAQAMRLDVFLSGRFPELSRTALKELIGEDAVRVNGKKTKPSYRLSKGDLIELDKEALYDLISLANRGEGPLLPSRIELDILYEDPYLLAINKPRGMVVHPSPGHRENTLANALLFHYGQGLSDLGGPLRPGIVHRLDKDTSGLLLVAKDNSTHKKLALAFAKQDIVRKYHAICLGVLKDKRGKIDLPIGRDKNNRQKNAVRADGKQAVSFYKLLDTSQNFSLVEVELKTGRTHQIRVHMSAIGHPVLGDELYGGRQKNLTNRGQALHARELLFKHPDSNRNIMLKADFPQDLKLLLEELKLKSNS